MYKAGDIVKLTSVFPENTWDYSMRKYLGAIIKIPGDDIRDSVFKMEGWFFRWNEIERKATEEEMEEWIEIIRKREEKKIAELKKKCRGKIYKTEDVQQIANDVFGEKFVDVAERAVIIHFPQILITNSAGGKHEIRNLYTKIEWREYVGEYFSAELSGIRTTFSLKEWLSLYNHSHMSGSYMGKWVGFCLGASDFNIILQNLKLDPTRENWEMFFYSLSAYLSWESLEGGPYARIMNISYGGNRYNNDEIKRELERINSLLPPGVFEWGIEGLKLMKNHPKLRDVLNEHSTIRNVSGWESDRIDEYIKSVKKEWCPELTEFKGRSIVPEIYCDDNPVDKQISKETVVLFENQIEEKLKIFNNKLKYEQAKNRRGEIVFGKDRTLKSSKCNNNREVAKAN